MRSDVDFVITFEELAGMFDARGIELKGIQAEDKLEDATGRAAATAWQEALPVPLKPVSGNIIRMWM